MAYLVRSLQFNRAIDLRMLNEVLAPRYQRRQNLESCIFFLFFVQESWTLVFDFLCFV